MSDTQTYSSDIAFTPAVKAIQTRKGSRDAYAEVEQSGMSQMAVNQHERSPIFRVPGDDQRLDNPYFADRGDDAL